MSRGVRLEAGMLGGGRVVIQARFKHWTAGSGSGVREEEMTEEILRG